jgi:chromosome segregation ATPase
MPSAVPDVKLGEVMQFVEWLQPAMKAIEKRERLPDSPSLGAGEVGTWIQAIRKLEEDRRESEEIQTTLKSEMKDREAYVGRLSQQLQTSITEAKAAQATSQELQRDVATYKGMLSKVGELSGEIARYDGQMKSVAGEILNKGSQLDKLAHSFREVAEALKSITKPNQPR